MSRKLSKHFKALEDTNLPSVLPLIIAGCETKAQLHAVCMILLEARDVIRASSRGQSEISDKDAALILQQIKAVNQ